MWPINLQECEGPTNMGDWGAGFLYAFTLRGATHAHRAHVHHRPILVVVD